MSLNVGTVNGSAIRLQDLDVARMLIGQEVSELASGDVYRLTISTATVDHDEVEAVLGHGSLRWLKQGAVSSVTGAGVDNTDPANPVVNVVDDYDGWFQGVVDTMHAAAPALTNFREIKLGDRPGATLALIDDTDGNVVGGGLTNLTADVTGIAASIFQTPKTTSWAMAFRAKLPTPDGSNFYFIGMVDVAGTTNYVGVASYGTGSATKWTLYIGPGPTLAFSSSDADALYHDFVLTFNGTTIKLYIDGVLEASQATLTHVSDIPMLPGLYGPLPGDVKAARFAYGYIAP